MLILRDRGGLNETHERLIKTLRKIPRLKTEKSIRARGIHRFPRKIISSSLQLDKLKNIRTWWNVDYSEILIARICRNSAEGKLEPRRKKLELR